MKMANIDAAFDWIFTDPRFADGVSVVLQSHAVERKHYNGSLTAWRFVLLSIFERYLSGFPRDTPYFAYIVHVSIQHVRGDFTLGN